MRIKIEAANPEWRDQGTVTLRLSDVLDQAALTTIFERVMREGVGLRNIKDKMANTTLGVDGMRRVARADNLVLEVTDDKKYDQLWAGRSAAGPDKSEIDIDTDLDE